MKWILFLLALLVVGVPGFAQRTNPQGKKLVKSINIVEPFKSSSCVLVFRYNNDGCLSELQLPTLGVSFIKEGNHVICSPNGAALRLDQYVATLDKQNRLSSIKEFHNTHNGSKQWQLWEYKYDYDYEIGGDAIVELSSSDWVQFNGKAPEPFGYEEIKHNIFSYFDGMLQNCFYITSYGEDHSWTNVDQFYTYTDLIDDTSINLMFLILFPSADIRDVQRLLLTEWCPTTAIKLPKAYVWEKRRTGTKQTIYTYEYVYEDDNLTTILIHRMWKDEISSTKTINIEYYY